MIDGTAGVVEEAGVFADARERSDRQETRSAKADVLMYNALRDHARPVYRLDTAELEVVARRGVPGAGQNIPIANPCVYTSTGSFAALESLVLGVPMFAQRLLENLIKSRRFPRPYFKLEKVLLAAAVSLFLFLVLFLQVPLTAAQDQSQPPQQNTPPADSGSDNSAKPKQEAPPEAGGPGGNLGPYAIPRRNPEEAPPPPPPPV